MKLRHALPALAPLAFAAAMAALLSGGYRPAKDERVGVVLCGANTGAVSFT